MFWSARGYCTPVAAGRSMAFDLPICWANPNYEVPGWIIVNDAYAW